MADDATRLEFSGHDAVEQLKNALDIIDASAAEKVELVVHKPTDDTAGDGGTQPASLPPSGRTDGWERPGEDPGNIRAGTHQHIVLVALTWYLDGEDAESATRDDLAGEPYVPLGQEQVGSALGALFRDKAAATRRWESDAKPQTGMYRYKPTPHGRREAARLGQWDADGDPSMPDEAEAEEADAEESEEDESGNT